jgi:hypothetical protein
MITSREASKIMQLPLVELEKIQDVLESDDFYDVVHVMGRIPPTEHDMSIYNTITQEQYEEFQYYWILDALKGWRYGQAFCERFGISNASPLYHFKGQDTAERWIRDNYLVKK